MAFLEPFTITCSNLIQAYYQIEKNKTLIDTLEDKVAERTRKLMVANVELEQANHRVTRASEAQLQHFACMSHEIRTPLNCIIGLLSLLQESKLSPMQEESILQIVASGELLVTVVNDVLDYSKLESGNVDVEIRRTQLQEALNSIVHNIDMKAATKKIALRTVYDFELPEFVQTDERRLQQILFNLLGNAVKFSRKGSTVELHVLLADAQRSKSGYTYEVGDEENRTLSGSTSTASPLTQRGANVSKDRAPVVVRYVVKDYGKGINRSEFEKIFKPFRQASAETERVYGGTGLGLAM